MSIQRSAKRAYRESAFRRCFIPNLGVAALLFAFAAGHVLAADGGSRAAIAVRNQQTAGSDLALTVGLTPNGDGSSCGTATSVEVNVGDIVDLCYTVTNHSATDLAYSSLDDSIDGNLFHYIAIPIPAGGSYVWHRRIRARTSETYSATWTAQDVAPGYTFDDTVPSAFVDIRTTGTRLDVLDSDTGNGDVTDDTATVGIESPFDFAFYGIKTNQFCVTTLGTIFPGLSSCDSYGNGNQPIPITSRTIIAPFWAQLSVPAGGVYWEVQGAAPNLTLIVEWDRGHVTCDFAGDQCYDTPLRANFEVIIGEDGSIAFQYLTTVFGVDFPGNFYNIDHGLDATIGLGYYEAEERYSPPYADTWPHFANQYSYRTALPHADPSAIAWTAVPVTSYTANANVSVDAGMPILQVVPTAIVATASSGSSVPVTAAIAIANAGDRDLDWSVAEAPSAMTGHPASVNRTLERAVIATDAQRRSLRADATTAHLGRSITQALLSDTVTNNAAANANAGSDTPATNVLSADMPCGDTVPGVVIHDDGTVNSGGRGASDNVTVAVEKFTPTYYPATFTSVCAAFDSVTWMGDNTADPIDYEVVIYDDTGVDGGPGNELGAVSASTTTTAFPWPEYYHPVAFHDSVDISGLHLNITSGSVYIGVRWRSEKVIGGIIHYSFIGADTNGTDGVPPKNAPDGNIYWNFGDGVFYPTSSVSSFTDFVSLMIRAVENAPGCTNPDDVPWLSVSPSSGTVAVGDPAANMVVTMDPSGLADGPYSATLCIASGYRTIAVPVELAVGGEASDEIFADGFD